MKQVQSEPSWSRPAGRWWSGKSTALHHRRRTNRLDDHTVRELEQSSVWLLGQVFVVLFTTLWFVMTLPFRLVFWVIAWLGRLTAVVLGFSLMVVGMALWAGPFFFIGIPLFLVGLVLTLRCLD
jgi:hypothetical protein